MIFCTKNKIGIVLASLCLAGIAAPAVAQPSFTLNPGAFGKGSPFTADFLSGNGSYLLHLDPGVGVSAAGYLNFTSATLATNAVLNAGFPTTYQFYITFQSTDKGTANFGQSNSLTTLNVQMWIDPTRNTVFTGATASGGVGTPTSIGGNSDDILVAYSTLIQGTDGIDVQGGAFLNATETFNVCSGGGTALRGATTVAATAATAGTNGNACLSDVGRNFFNAPFFDLAFTELNNTATGAQRSGDFIAVTSASGGADFDRVVPEPGSLALFGIAGAGIVATRRRRKT